MFKFIGNTLKLFFGFVFIVIPLSLIGVWLFLNYLVFCDHIAGSIEMILGAILLMSMIFAWLMRYE
ncbi:hypothetical protein H9L25_00580 [Terrisporobacter mayombei]|nr:hypothetical protein [Terrisporobacter mayombei]